MRFRHAKMIDEFDHVPCQPLESELGRPGNFRVAVTAQLETHDAEIAREMRHPRVEAVRIAHRRMHHDQRFALAPRIGVIVDVVAQA
jgi:hypothetical protein